MVQIHDASPLAPYATRELLHRYGLASADHKRRGRTWYDAARRECRRIARETGISYAKVAAVLAITSPDAQLVTNVEWTDAICRGGRPSMAGRYPSDQAPKVRAALKARHPGRYASGPKVQAFYRAICGDTDGLVIDRWAAYAAGGNRDAAPSAKARRALESAYRAAAAKVGETVRDFQAIVWIQARETTPSKRHGIVHRLQDITA